MSKRHAEISGAGISGLITAAALARRGWTVRVHEREEDLRSYGSGIACWYNFVKCITAVGARKYLLDYRPFYIRETRDEKNRVLYTLKASEKQGPALRSVARPRLQGVPSRPRSVRGARRGASSSTCRRSFECSIRSVLR